MGDEGGAIEFSPRSAAIKRVVWNADTGIMMVTFSSGRMYSHDDVPRDVVESFRDAVSAGSFYNSEIRGSY
jgi:hypothetical protein